MPVGSSGVTEDKGEITLFHTFGVDLEELAGLVGDVLVAEFSGFTVGSHVGPEEAEIPCVTRPYPVVVLSGELSYGARGDIDEPQILEVGVEKENIALPAEHFGHFRTLAGILLLRVGDDLLDPLLYRFRPCQG